MPEIREYANLVSQMREKQREFFDPKRRTASTLGQAKRLERQVDRATAEVLADDGQEDLSGRGL